MFINARYQYTELCSKIFVVTDPERYPGLAVTNPERYPDLASDSAALLAAKDPIECTTLGKLNWSPYVPISYWNGVTIHNNRISELRLRGYGLNGRIPAELGKLAYLTVLNLNGNLLTGEIPPQLGNLAKLVNLGLADNRLDGKIPAELGNLANLRVLSLHGNRLEGDIPAELGNLAKLTNLSLHGDMHWLTGCIPTALRAPLGSWGIKSIRLPLCDAPAPTPNLYTKLCYDGIVIQNPHKYPDLVAGCATLLAAKATLDSEDGNLN